jgi:GxxExxY protein
MGSHEPVDEVSDLIASECVASALAGHRALGPGYAEAIYRRSMVVEMKARGLAIEEECSVEIRYRGVAVGRQRIDLICGELVIVELKAIERLERVHVSQVVSYLHATGLRLGLLINFRVVALKYGLRRVVL